MLARLISEGHSLGCCPINVTEVFAGLRPSEEAPTLEFLRSLDYYEITWEAARQAGLMKREWASRGATLGVPDLMIAALAIQNDLVLITDNVKDFPMPELRLYPLPEDA